MVKFDSYVGWQLNMVQPLTDEDLHVCCQDRVAAMNAELMEKSPQEILQWAVSGRKQWSRPR